MVNPMEVLASGSSPRVFFVKVSKGEKALEAVSRAAEKTGIVLGVVSAIGGFSEAAIGVFRAADTTYEAKKVVAQPGKVLEVVSFSGNVLCTGEGCKPHIHVVLARGHSEIYAGHLIDATVDPFLELFIIEAPVDAREAVKALEARLKLRPRMETV